MMVQQNRQSQQDFNRMTQQRQQDFQQRSMQRSMDRNSYRRATRPLTAEEVQQAQQKQQQAEQQATDKLAQLAQQQQRQRQEHPAASPELAAAQQKKDDKQLSVLAVRNYHDVFLPDQVSRARQEQQFSPSAQRALNRLHQNLSEKSWWKKQEDAQLPGSIKAYGDTLRVLTTGLFGFDLTSPPAMPAPLSMSGVMNGLATHTFDQGVATKLIQDAALSEKLLAGRELTKAVTAFSSLSTSAAANPELASNPKKLREQVQASLREVEAEVVRYYARLDGSDKITNAQKALVKSTEAYLARNKK